MPWKATLGKQVSSPAPLRLQHPDAGDCGLLATTPALAKPVLDQAPLGRIPGHQWLSQRMTSGARNVHAARPPSGSHYPRSAAGNLICVSAPSARLGEIDLGSLETSAAGRKVRHICAHVAGPGTVHQGPRGEDACG